MDYYKGVLRDESVEISVIPEEQKIRAGFEGNREFVRQQRERLKMVLDEKL